MKLHVYATLRSITKNKTIDLSALCVASVAEVLSQAISRYPALQEQIFEPDGSLGARVNVFVNGRNVLYLDKQLATMVSATDKIDLFPGVAGG